MLLDTLTLDMQAAIKSGDKVKLDTLRFLVSEIRNVQIDKGELSDAQVLQIIQRQQKQIEEAKSEFAAANRTDLVASETAKSEILATYLPEALSDEELGVLVERVVAETPNANMGTVMPQIMQQVAGRADGAAVAQAVQQALAK